jgi:hypothetical protein
MFHCRQSVQKSLKILKAKLKGLLRTPVNEPLPAWPSGRSQIGTGGGWVTTRGEGYHRMDITGIIAVDLMKPAKLTVPQERANVRRWHAEVSARPSASA